MWLQESPSTVWAMAQKTSGTLVALGTAAVTAIYMTGYLATASASQAVAPDPTQTPVVATATAVPTTTLVPTATTAATAAVVNDRPSPTPTPRPSTPTTQSTYKDGTYTGTGNSRRGGFDVAVMIQGGRIASVQITRAFTQYPASRVSGLPAQVVARQSARVDNVSGATYSAQAFQQAVAQALAQAAA
jgi:uncharacterized protein with FMN-binding domain